MSTGCRNPEDAVELVANAAEPQPSPGAREAPARSQSPAADEVPKPRTAALCLYRKRTISLLRRYARLSLEAGRISSALAGAEFRAKVSSYPLHTFEDAVIFVFDIERCLGWLDEQSYELIARVVFQGDDPEQAARAMQCSRTYTYRLLLETLDKLTKMFLRRGILDRSKISPKSCQGGKNGVFSLSS